MKKRILLSLLGIVLLSSGCTDLSETLYSAIGKENYYTSRKDVLAVFLRPFNQATGTMYLYWRNYQEDTADFYATFHRQAHWLDGQTYYRLHYHTWTIDDTNVSSLYSSLMSHIGRCNQVIYDFEHLDYQKLGVTTEEMTRWIGELRALRAWQMIRAFAVFRNIPLVTQPPYGDLSKNSVGQATPVEMSNWLEQELLEVIDMLPIAEKLGAGGGNGINQERWNKAGAASLLVRLYLNAEKWTGVAKYTECAALAQRIIDGQFGPYSIDERWDQPFDSDNGANSKEIIYAFNTMPGQTWGQYNENHSWWCLPFVSPPYFNFLQRGNSNPRFGLQPGRDLQGNEYAFELGKPVVKFQRYPSDVRLKLYKNTSNSTREGMFLYGYLIHNNVHGRNPEGLTDTVTWDNYRTVMYIRDQAGWFEDTPPEEISPRLRYTATGDLIAGYDISDFAHADQNSGWYNVKWPIYPDAGPYMQSDHVEIRLPEIIYSLAECKFRAGDADGAGLLLNSVRKRYYPEEDWAAYLYAPEGAITLTAEELLDEWGREFLGEDRRATDLVRWNKYCSSEWRDKQPEPDNHTEIYPISRSQLLADPNLKQNPGYEDPR